MAKETVYNNTLVSGAADETLTYTRYIKDESSGKSTKELLDEKVNKTDQLGTTQITNKAVTTEKLADQSVDNSKIASDAVTYDKIKNGSVIPDKIGEGAVTTEKIETKAVTNEKIGDSAVDGRTIQEGVVQTKHLANESVTNAKIATNSISRDKLEPSIRKELADTISAANAATSKADQATEDAKNATAAATAAKEAADNATQLATNATTASNQATELAKDATTKADDATARANEAAQKADDSREQTEQTLGTMQEVIDKVAIKDEEGTMVETPFRYIQSEEFIFAKVDAEDKLLFGIHWDGTPEFGKTSAVEDRLQSQVTLLAERVATIMGDEDTTNVIDTMNELKKFFAEIENTETLTSILANLNSLNTKFGEDIKNLQETKVDKEEGKSLIEDEVKECFRIIENEEFIKAVVDSEDRVLFGFFRATGKPYYPLNEMYHVEQNEEFFAVWVTTDDKVVLGIRRDGEIIGEIHAVNALKQVISQLQADLASLQEKVDTMDSSLKELLDVFSLQENPEYLAVEKDAEGKILSTTNLDGSHYIHNVKSETIENKVDKEDGKSLINSDVAESHTVIEDPEERTEITTDADDKLLGYREKDGTRYEHKQKVENMSVNHFFNLSQTACQDIVNSLSAYGLTLENKLDFSDNTEIFIPIPRGVAVVNIIADSLATSKTQNKDAILEFWGSGIYFRKNIILNAQGQTSMAFAKKNQSLDFKDGTSIKFGDWVPQDSFHLKANADDVFCGINNIVYKYADYVVGKTDTRANRVLHSASTSYQNASGKFNADFDDNAKCMPDGFPISLHLNGEFYGMYSWNMKKHRANYSMDKKDYTSIMIDPDRLTSETFWNGTIDWSKFELKNPKTLICMDGLKYDGDNPKELIDSTSEKYDESNKDMKNTAITKSLLVSLSNAMPAVNALSSEEEKKAKFKELFDYDNLVVYFLVSNAIGNYDGLWGRNTVFTIYNSGKCGFNFYDCNAVFGREARGWYAIKPDEVEKASGTPFEMLDNLFHTEVAAEYAKMRTNNFISVDTICSFLNDWLKTIGAYSISRNLDKWNEIPSYRDGSKTYPSYPTTNGFYDSFKRCEKWVKERISFMDNFFGYNV